MLRCKCKRNQHQRDSAFHTCMYLLFFYKGVFNLHFSTKFCGMKILVFGALLSLTLCQASDLKPYPEALDLERVYYQAESTLAERQIEEFASGSTSNRFHQKRDNALTKEMAKRNSLFRQMNFDLESQGINSEESKRLAKRGIKRWHKVRFTQTEKGKVFSMIEACGNCIPSCDKLAKFRSFDGTCNNLQNPLVGSAGIALPRYKSTKPTNIQDPIKNMTFGQSLSVEPNKAKKNGCHLRKNLPNARLVSRIIHVDKDAPSTNATHFTTQFGQFVDHDITLTPTEAIDQCCDDASAGDERCLPIDVSKDEYFNSINITCLHFTRSVPHCEENGGRRNQLNGITSYVDGSQIYGSDLETAKKIRTFANGELKVTVRDSGNLLPMINDTFTAGEARAREIPGLTLSHTLWVREHNRVAKILSNMLEDDEEIYQLARRVVVAEYQNIVYGQYMSVILGTDDLKPKPKGSKYKPKINPAMTNEFATAAYRFGHSMVQGKTKLLAVDNPSQEVGSFQLRDVFFEDDFYVNAFENILMELIYRPSQNNDASMSEEVTNHLIAAGRISDLASLNIHRGREHGLPGFCCYYRKFQSPGFNCKSGWETKYEGIPDNIWAKMEEVYDHPSDIDLFTGGISQLSGGQGQLGGVFRAMISDQFTRLMKGDRFFFNHQNSPTLGGVGFTKEAREIIQNRTMSGVICDNTSLTKVTSNVFQMNSDIKNCSETAKIEKAEIMQLIKFNNCE